tara:strand:+ start:213 stop:827 length:615 start_codon:yes stop_codon:yes gene_type:complete
MTKKISIVDYKNCNIGSVKNMLKYLDIEHEICDTPEKLEGAKKILLPGVGSFDEAILNIKKLSLKEILDKKALREKIPILGICLGMQILTKYSEEGKQDGLGWIEGKTKKFDLPDKLSIPHMGWNTINIKKKTKLTKDFDNSFKFYFVHSYYVELENEENCLSKTNYGKDFNSIINYKNIFGAQFHPEKSHKFGMTLLRNFANI